MTPFSPRGPLSSALLDSLSASPPSGASTDVTTDGSLATLTRLAAAERNRDRLAAEVLADDDLQLTLYLGYELHYGGLPGVDDGWEWEPELIATRRHLEAAFERALREVDQPVRTTPAALPRTLFAMAAADSGPSLAGYIARHATVEQVTEALVVRSPYQLKEGDPQTFAIPRLLGQAKAALVEIQTDEYGGGHVDRMHATLFRSSMRALGLDDTPNGYLDQVPAVVLASHNALSLFALNRRLRGALCGHLAVFEMTSSLPAKRWVSGMQRLGLPTQASEFFDEHIEADAVHEQIAAHDLCGALVRDEPALLDDVLLGAGTCLAMDSLVAQHLLTSWENGGSALRAELPARRHLASA